MGRHSDLTEVELLYLGETEYAIRVEDADEKTVWLPKSQVEIEMADEPVVGTKIVVTMPQWLAEEKGLV